MHEGGDAALNTYSQLLRRKDRRGCVARAVSKVAADGPRLNLTDGHGAGIRLSTLTHAGLHQRHKACEGFCRVEPRRQFDVDEERGELVVAPLVILSPPCWA